MWQHLTRGVLVCGLVTASSVSNPLLSAAERDPGLIRRENERPGARDWQLTRVALQKGSLVVNSSQGGGSKDTWVLRGNEGGADA